MISILSTHLSEIDVNIMYVFGAVVLIAGWAFSFGILYSKVNEAVVMTAKVFKEVTRQDERLDKLESRVLVIETAHKLIHDNKE